MKRFFVHNDKFYAMADNVGRSVSRMAVGIAIARMCGSEEYAVFVLLLTVEVLFTSTTNAIFLGPMTTIVPGLADTDRAGLIQHAVTHHLRWSLAGAVLALGATPLVVSANLSAVTYVGFCASLFLTSMTNIFRGRSNSLFHSKTAFWADLCWYGISLLGMGIGGWYWQGAMGGFWWGNAVGALIALIGLTSDYRREGRQSYVPDKLLGRFIRLGAPMLFGSIACSVCSRVQPLILGILATNEQIALFGVAATFIAPLRVLTVATSSALRPRMAVHYGMGDRSKARQVLLMTIGALSGLGVATGMFFVLVGSVVINYVFGMEYAGVQGLLPWAAVFVILEAVGSMLVVAMQTEKDQGTFTATRLRILTAMLALVLMWPACSGYGALGAFVALVIAEGVFVMAAAVSSSQILWFVSPHKAVEKSIMTVGA